MKTKALLFLLMLPCLSKAQKADTIVTMRNKIVGFVKEVTPDVIAYSNPNETVVYKIERSAVAQINFGSGRVEKFNELRKLKKLSGPSQWEKIEVAMTEYETKGLHKIGLVNVKATGTTIYSSVSNVQNRSLNKLKMAAALMGGNLVYLKNDAIEGNIRSSQGGRTARSQLLGVVYNSELIDTAAFHSFIKDNVDYSITSHMALRNNDAEIQYLPANSELVKINSYLIEDGFILLNMTIGKKPSNIRYRVIQFNENRLLVAYQQGTAYHNLLLAEH